MIRIEAVAKRYGTVTALDGVDFHVARGETFGVIGPNGAGKTTLLKVLLGLVRPDRGRVHVDGVDLARDPRGVRSRMGYVPQRAVFEEGVTGREAMEFLARLRGLPDSAIGEYASLAGVGSLLDRQVGTLSGGQRQRLSLAAALLGDPPVLLLDEPTASLDPQATADFRTLVQRLAGLGRTMILCSHLLADVERLCHRVLILLDGRVAAVENIASTKPVALYVRVARDPRIDRLVSEFAPGAGWTEEGTVRVDLPPPEQLRFLSRLHESGAVIGSLETRRPTLEERFLAAVAGTDGSMEP